uniref:small monomeric GTPase n=1 Tax=Arcella intermedia TaxID=1963864 RepID=A0A6B2LFT7_9EUKA
MSEVKIVLLGEGGVGKSALVIQFIINTFLDAYDPIIEDSYRKQVTIDEETCILDILDTAGYEDFSSLRDHYMRTSQSFILIFSITSRKSFEALKEHRERIIKVKGQEKFPLILCGNKNDLESEKEVSDFEAEELARSWGCPFVKTSAKRRMNVDELFFDTVREVRKELVLLESVKKEQKSKKKGKEVKEEEEEKKEKRLEERQYEARKALLKDLLKDGIISSSTFDEYNQKNKTTLGINQ